MSWVQSLGIVSGNSNKLAKKILFGHSDRGCAGSSEPGTVSETGLAFVVAGSCRENRKISKAPKAVINMLKA